MNKFVSSEIGYLLLVGVAFTLGIGVVMIHAGHLLGIFIAGYAILTIVFGWKKFDPAVPEVGVPRSGEHS